MGRPMADDTRHSSTHAVHCYPGDRPPAMTEPARFSARRMIRMTGYGERTDRTTSLRSDGEGTDMSDTVFETRGHYLFSWTFPTPSGAKPVEELRFLFSVALPMPLGNQSFMQHFWFDQKITGTDEMALYGAKNDRFITWAKG